MKTVLIQSFPLLSLLALGGCGEAEKMPDFNSPGQPVQTVFPADGSNIIGKYKAEFISMNTSIVGFVKANAYVYKKEDRFHVSLEVSKGSPGITHKQDLRMGWRCPMVPQDDKNGDGFIDIEEGNKVWGKVIIPLDSDLSSQQAGKNKYPVANSAGNYEYKRSASFEAMFKDLKDEASADSDATKLAENEGYGLLGNVIVILGTSSSANIPDTAARVEGVAPHKNFPVACGLIRKLSDDSGEFEDTESSNEFGNPDAPSETLPTPPPVDNSEPEVPPPTTSEPNNDNDDDSENWDDRLRDWWRRTVDGDDD